MVLSIIQELGSWGWGNCLAVAGGTRPSEPQPRFFKKLHKNPLGNKPSWRNIHVSITSNTRVQGWESGAGVGVGKLRGAGDSLAWKVSWFLGFKDLPNFHFMSTGRFCSISPNFHSMFFGRYWSHIQDIQEFIRRIFGLFRCPSFRIKYFRFTKLWVLQAYGFFRNVPGISRHF